MVDTYKNFNPKLENLVNILKTVAVSYGMTQLIINSPLNLKMTN